MTRHPSSATVTIAAAAVLGGIALAAQDKYTLQVPNGLAFSDFRGYENWEDVAVSATETGIKVIVANRDDGRLQRRPPRCRQAIS